MKFDELLNNVIGYIYSLPPIGFFLLFLVGTGVLIDSILNNDGRKKVTEYILLTSGSRERFKFLKVYTYLLDKVFSFNKRGLIFYPAVTKSTACSILVVLLIFSVSPIEMLSSMLEMSVYTLAIIFAANILTDYISISETRLMIDLASKSLSTFKIVLIFILDLVLSIAFVLLVYFAIEVVNTVFYPDYYLNSDFYGANYFITLDQNVNIFYAVYVGLIDLFTMSPSDWDIGQRLRLVFLLSNLTTSIWLWFFLAGLSIQRIIQIPKRIRYFIAKYTVFNSKPLTISSAFLSIVLILIFSPYNALWSRSLLSYDRAIVKLNNDNYPTIIYFRNDSFHLEPVAEAALDNLALSLITNPKKIRLEGNQDPFGSREYAIAIGDRRSQSVKRYLIHKGVDQSLIDTVSYGEEMLDTSIPLYEIRPAHKNFRRVEIIYSH